MSSMVNFLHRNWRIISPPAPVPKLDDAGQVLKFGILGAANIGPFALIYPARLHPEVVVQAVAARDKSKAEAYAKKYGIPEVKGSYDELIADPSLQCIYIPLPNALHYEWTLKSLSHGKHVLLEKPATCNSTEAELLFRSPLLTAAPSPPVLLEAFHYKFQPSWLLFVSLIDSENVASAKVDMHVPNMFKDGDIRWDYGLGGGAMMDLSYTSSVLRALFNSEPTACVTCDVQTVPSDSQRIDYAYSSTWQFPNGGVGQASGNLKTGFIESLWGWKMARAEVIHKPVVVITDTAANPALNGNSGDGESEQVTTRTRRVKMKNWLMGAFWHSIVVEDEFVTTKKKDGGDDDDEVVKKWTTREVKKGYTFKEAGIGRGGDDDDGKACEPYWLTYKHQLDAFVDRVKGRESKTGAWVGPEDSINQARMTDMAYERSGLGLRPTSGFRLE